MPEPNKERTGRIRCVLYDVDGTLVDTTDLIAEGLAETVESGAGFRPPRSELVALIGRPLVEQLRQYVDESRVAELADRFMTFYEARRRESEVLFPGALEMLDESRRLGLSVGLVTSKNRREIDGTLELLGIGDRLDCVICSEDAARPKPAPDPVREAIRRLEVDPGETLFVGDSVYDIRSGRAAGVRTGGALWGPFGRSILEPESPSYLFSSPEETTSSLRRFASLS